MSILPTLRQLQYAVALAEEGNFTRAAAKCCVTQSAFSTAIKDLESLLGIRLFERTTRRVIITPAGEQCVNRARKIIASANSLVEASRHRPFTGDLRLGSIPTVGPYLLPNLLETFGEMYPDMKLYLREDRTKGLLNWLEEGRLDVLLLAMPVDTADFIVRDVGRDELMLACPVGHPLASKRVVTMEDVKENNLLVLEDGHCLREHTLSACNLTDQKAYEDFQATSLPTLLHMVAAGLGVALFPSIATARELETNRKLVLRKISHANPARRIAVVWRKNAVRQEEFEEIARIVAQDPLLL